MVANRSEKVKKQNWARNLKRKKDSTFELLLLLQRNKSSRSHILLLFLRIIIAKNSSKARQQRRKKHLETTIACLSSFTVWGRHLVPPQFSLSLYFSLKVSLFFNFYNFWFWFCFFCSLWMCFSMKGFEFWGILIWTEAKPQRSTSLSNLNR